MLKQVQKGFALIELMIVVAIIGILAAIAIPAAVISQQPTALQPACEAMVVHAGFEVMLLTDVTIRRWICKPSESTSPLRLYEPWP